MQSVLRVDLAALAHNYHTLAARFSGRETAAVVKANAYGLGVTAVSQALSAAGCRRFFVATLAEGIALRAVLPAVEIHVFHGAYPGEEQDFLSHRLIPVINNPAQLERWRAIGRPYILHLDTGMCRLGLTESELAQLSPHPANDPHLHMVMSHLACSGEPAHPKNAEQLQRFSHLRAHFPHIPASLCNSSAIYLDNAFHFDIARPGVALYGVNPTPLTDTANPMRAVVEWTAPILQIRQLDREETVGYGATCLYPKDSRIAIAQLGYADGYLRLLGNKGTVFIGGQAAPIVGRVSMDMIAIDASRLPESIFTQEMQVEILGSHQSVDDLAEAAGTIGYEILTRIGSRVRREYVNAP